MQVVQLTRDQDSGKYFKDLTDRQLVDYGLRGLARWNWQYLNNPASAGQELSSWICRINGEDACHLGAIPVEISVQGQKLSGAWLVDFMTAAEFRRRGLGKSLVEEAFKKHAVLLSIGQTEKSRNLFIKMGWEYLGELPLWVIIWDLKPIILEKLKNPFLSSLIAKPLNLALKLVSNLDASNGSGNIQITPLEFSDHEADELWERISPEFSAVVNRTQAYMHWKYDLQPDMHYIKMKAVKNNVVCGYIVFRIVPDGYNKPEGLIVDIVASPKDHDTVQALVLEALKHLKNSGRALVRAYSSHKLINQALAKCRFIKRKVPMSFVIKCDRLKLKEAVKLDDWHIFAGDCDIDR